MALLRGINIGGNNIVRMADLKDCFAAAGFTDVVTYINSGNVLFRAPRMSLPKLTEKIEQTLHKRLALPLKVVVATFEEVKEAVERAPKGFGVKPDKYRYDVIFLKSPLTVRQAISGIPFKPGVDQVTAGRQVIYFSRLIAKASQSKLSRVIALPIYKSMTIRNWNTTSKLYKLMEERA